MTSCTPKVATVLAWFALVTGLAGLTGFSASVQAQTTGTVGATGSTGAQPAAVGYAPATGAGPATAGQPGSAPVVMSASEQLTAANDIVTRGTNLSGRVAQMLDEARRDADMIRVTCLNDKLTQVNANMRTAQSRLAALQKATDADQRNHEFTVLSVLGQKFQALEQSSNQCVGQDLYDTGPTKVTTEIDTSLQPAENSPGTPPVTLPPIVLDVPPDASPKT